jgi:methylisocitrate lyase
MIPGAYNGLTGRMLSQKGFKAAYISGAAITGSKGVPDIGLTTLPEFCQIIREVSSSSALPVIADADTGFGEGEMCAKTVADYFQAGAAGLHIEDQVFPKRCGHLDGKTLVSSQEMVDKIRIMRKTSETVSEGQFIVCARTDARGVMGLEETINRSKAYIDAGADMIFPEGLSSKEEFTQVAAILKAYKPEVFLLANMTEFGKTPMITIDEF